MTKKVQNEQKVKSIRISKVPYPLVFDDYRDMLCNEMRPCTSMFLDHLAEDMVKWSHESEDNLKISQFFTSRGIAMQNLYRWMPKSEALTQAHEYVMTVIGDRREVRALKRELDSAMVRTTMPHYDKTWKELEEWRSKLKEPTESGDKVVVIERFPDVPSVPERKE